MLRRAFLLILCLSLYGVAADVKNMSGTWMLNAKRSSWGKKVEPLRAFVTIKHNEPKYAYSGSVTTSTESSEHFAFDGVIDGKDYPIKEDKAKRSMSVTRKGPDLIQSVIKTPDGKVQEVVEQSLSGDGKTLVRKIETTAPNGEKVGWTEIYEKKS